MKPLWRSKTFWFNFIRALVDSGLLIFLTSVDWAVLGADAKTAAYIVLVVSILDKVMNISLRMVTNAGIENFGKAGRG